MKYNNIEVLITNENKQDKYKVKKAEWKEYYLEHIDNSNNVWGNYEPTVDKLFKALEKDLEEGFCEKFEIIDIGSEIKNNGSVYMKNLLKKYGKSI